MEKALNLKYSEKVLFPHELIAEDGESNIYVLATGERVKIKRLGVWDNTQDRSARSLEAESRALFGLTFSQIESVWKRRIGELSGYWCKAKLLKQ